MSKKLNDQDLALIMSYVDGQLGTSEKAKVEKMISDNIEAKVAFEDLKLSTSFYGDYVSSIKEIHIKSVINFIRFSILNSKIARTKIAVIKES